MQSDRVGEVGGRECLPRPFTGIRAHGDAHFVDGRGGFGPEGEGGAVGARGVLTACQDEDEGAGCGVDAATVCGGPVLGVGEGKAEEEWD